MDGQHWRGFKWIAFAMGKFEKRWPTSFQIFGMLVYTCIKMVVVLRRWEVYEIIGFYQLG